MKRKGLKIAAYLLAGAMAMTAVDFQAQAAGIGSELPAAGIALVFEDGKSVGEVQREVRKEKNNSARAFVVSANSINKIVPNTVNEILVNTENRAIGMSAKSVTMNNNINNAAPSSLSVSDNKVVSNTENAEAPSTSDNTAPVAPGTITPENPTPGTIMDFVSEAEAKAKTEAEAKAKAEAELVKTPEEEEAEYFSTLAIAKVNDYVNVRSTPSEEGEIVGKLYDKSVGETISSINGWLEIQSGNVRGYVKAEYVVTGDAAVALAKEVGHRIATVTTTTLFVRSEPSTEASVMGMVPIEDEITVLEELDGWAKVTVEEGDGYVSMEFVTLSTEFVKAESKAEEEARKQKEEEARQAARAAANKATNKSNNSQSSNNSSAGSTKAIIPPSSGSDMGSSVASFARQFEGNPYVYGGTSLTNGADCSGFVSSVYANFGVGLPRTSGGQRGTGTDVGGIGNAQPGDIVCYSGHVGIYIGGGNIIHASTASTGIKISSATYKNILSVRRIF